MRKNGEPQTFSNLAMGMVQFLVLAGPVTAQIPCGGYEVTAIIQAPECPPFGYSPILPSGLNDRGWVVGHVISCVIGPDVAFLWTPEGGLEAIPMPPQTSQSRALAINGSKVVGCFANSNELGITGFLYDVETKQFTSLGTLPGGNWSEAHAVNSTGEIVGFWGDVVKGPSPLAFIWRDGEMIDINGDFATVNSEANGITDESIVTGWMGGSILSDARAFIWDEGKVTELPPIPGGFTSVGEVVGCANMVAGWGLRMEGKPVETVTRAFLWQAGEMIDLGTLPDHLRSAAFSLRNTPLQIVGVAWNVGGVPAIEHAFIWQNGVMTNLTDVLVGDPNLDLKSAVSINQIGQIAVRARSDDPDAIVAVVLTPVQGALGDLDGDGQVGVKDLLILLGNWGPCENCAACAADLDGNGVVGVADLLILLANWG